MTFSPSTQYEALSRLRVSEGLLITAQRWKHSQDYHRHRQNIYYQSLYEPGIVRGFGVQIMAPDPEQPRTFLVRISQGVAIDVAGNPIVLHCDCQLAIPAELDPKQVPNKPQTIHIIVRYQDPEASEQTKPKYINELPIPDEDTALEHCQIVKRFKMIPGDIELCRIELEPNARALSPATSVYNPKLNNLNFRYRQIARLRTQGRVKISQLYFDAEASDKVDLAFRPLLQATERLYPSLSTEHRVISVAHDLEPSTKETKTASLQHKNTLSDGHLIYIPYNHLKRPDDSNESNKLNADHIAQLKQQIKQGRIILIATNAKNASLQQQLESLKEGLVFLSTPPELDSDKHERYEKRIKDRIKNVESQMAHNKEIVDQAVDDFCGQLDYQKQGEGVVGADHPLRCFPFNFPDWPTLEQGVLDVRCWGAIVLVYADIDEIWADTDAEGKSLGRSHQTLRTAQEWGVNLLHYAWEHHHLTQLQQGRCSRD